MGMGATMCTRSGRSFQSCRKASESMPQMDHPGCPARKHMCSQVRRYTDIAGMMPCSGKAAVALGLMSHGDADHSAKLLLGMSGEHITPAGIKVITTYPTA